MAMILSSDTPPGIPYHEAVADMKTEATRGNKYYPLIIPQ